MGFRPDIAEAYNLLYGPVLYYHDIEKELKEEGFGGQFGDQAKTLLPHEEDFEQLIEVYERFIANAETPDLHRARMKQLDALVWCYRTSLPERLRSRYEGLVAAVGGHRDSQEAADPTTA